MNKTRAHRYMQMGSFSFVFDSRDKHKLLLDRRLKRRSMPAKCSVEESFPRFRSCARKTIADIKDDPNKFFAAVSILEAMCFSDHVADEFRMFEKVAYEKWSARKLFHWLKFDMNFKTPYGNKNMTLSMIYLILSNDFYYGRFEYPRKSGNWYQGKHESLITKELFDLVQEQISSRIMKVESKEFAFTKLMTCGLCGSGVSADEKFKKQKNGNIHRYAYYGCTKFNDKNCKCGYIEEGELIRQFEGLMATIDIDEIGIKEKIESEVKRFKKFNQVVLGIKETLNVSGIDIRNYAKYILREGTVAEKRELLGCLKGRVLLKNKAIYLEKCP